VFLSDAVRRGHVVADIAEFVVVQLRYRRTQLAGANTVESGFASCNRD
jgi:hypothetical protein